MHGSMLPAAGAGWEGYFIVSEQYMAILLFLDSLIVYPFFCLTYLSSLSQSLLETAWHDSNITDWTVKLKQKNMFIIPITHRHLFSIDTTNGSAVTTEVTTESNTTTSSINTTETNITNVSTSWPSTSGVYLSYFKIKVIIKVYLLSVTWIPICFIFFSSILVIKKTN